MIEVSIPNLLQKDSADATLEIAYAVVVCGGHFVGPSTLKGAHWEIKLVLAQLSPEKREKSAFIRLTQAKSEAYTSRVQSKHTLRAYSRSKAGSLAVQRIVKYADRSRVARLSHGSTHHLALISQGVTYE